MSKLLLSQVRFVYMIADLLSWCEMQGYRVTLGEAWRTEEQQDIYLAAGFSRVKHSMHQDRLAVDLNLIVDDRLATPQEYRPLGEYWEYLGGRWGGRFGVEPDDYLNEMGWDAGHFEYKASL